MIEHVWNPSYARGRGRIVVKVQPRQKSTTPYLINTKNKKGWRHGLSHRVLALLALGPEFKL
jgi:hypothetical protein